MNLRDSKKIYMIGIKGVGMSMLAQFLTEKGYEISGSDTAEVFMTDAVLRNAGIQFYEGFDEKNLPDKKIPIIYSSAYNEKTNLEFKIAKETGFKMTSFGEALGLFFNEYYGIAVCGSHGKTTTTAWLGFVLKQAGLEPNIMVGANVNQLGGCGLTGKSDYLIIEADEYQNKLGFYNPKAVLLNNIDYDHPDYFKDESDYLAVFVDFVKKIPKSGFLVANFDDQNIRKIANVNCRARVITYAIKESADYIAYDIKQEDGLQFFKVKLGVDFFDESDEPNELGDFCISLSGQHNIYNALAIIAASIELGVPLHAIRHYLEDFKGVSRRMEVLGKYRGALIIDDYAHHPTEISATLEGVKKSYPDKHVLTVFHPHTYSRTKGLLDEFAKSFSNTDELIVLDIYGSAREKQGGVHSKDLILKIEKENPNLHVVYIPTLKECENYLRGKLEKDFLLVLMGAGDVFRVGKNLIEK